MDVFFLKYGVELTPSAAVSYQLKSLYYITVSDIIASL